MLSLNTKQQSIFYRYLSQPQLFNIFTQNQRNYISLQKSIQHHYVLSQQNKFFKFVSYNHFNLYFFYGCQYSEQHIIDINSLTLFLINQIQLRQPIRSQTSIDSYTFIFFAHETEHKIWIMIRQCFKKLPIQYHLQLKHLIIVSPSIHHKIANLFTINPLSRQLYTKIIYAENTSDMCDICMIPQKYIAKLLPRAILVQDGLELLCEQQKHIKDSINFNLNSEIVSKKWEDKQKIKCIADQRYELDDFTMCKQGVPLILEAIFQYFRQKQQFLKVEGLFRKSVDFIKMNSFLDELAQQGYCIINLIEQPHLIANLLKKFLCGLKYPLVPFNQSSNILFMIKNNDKNKVISIIQSLPLVSYIVLRQLLKFLKFSVLVHKDQNKLSVENVSILLMPCIMRIEVVDQSDLERVKQGIKATKYMVQNYDKIFKERKIKLNSESNFKKNDGNISLKQRPNLVNQKYSTRILHCLKFNKKRENKKDPQIKNTNTNTNTNINKNTNINTNINNKNESSSSNSGIQPHTKIYKSRNYITNICFNRKRNSLPSHKCSINQQNYLYAVEKKNL